MNTDTSILAFLIVLVVVVCVGFTRWFTALTYKEKITKLESAIEQQTEAQITLENSYAASERKLLREINITTRLSVDNEELTKNNSLLSANASTQAQLAEQVSSQLTHIVATVEIMLACDSVELQNQFGDVLFSHPVLDNLYSFLTSHHQLELSRDTLQSRVTQLNEDVHQEVLRSKQALATAEQLDNENAQLFGKVVRVWLPFTEKAMQALVAGQFINVLHSVDGKASVSVTTFTSYQDSALDSAFVGAIAWSKVYPVPKRLLLADQA
jgi:hypothetical protein